MHVIPCPNQLHSPPMLVDETNFGLVLYNNANFKGLRKHLVIGQLNEYQFFSAFHWSTSDPPPASQCTNIGNTARAVHSCNSWLLGISENMYSIKSKTY